MFPIRCYGWRYMLSLAQLKTMRAAAVQGSTGYARRAHSYRASRLAVSRPLVITISSVTSIAVTSQPKEAEEVEKIAATPQSESAIIVCAASPQFFPVVAPICTDIIVYEAPLVYLLPLCSIPTESEIVVCAAPPQSFPAPICTDIIVYEAPRVHLLPLCSILTESAITACAASPQPFPAPICIDIIVYEAPRVFLLPLCSILTESAIIVCAAPPQLFTAPICTDIIVNKTPRVYLVPLCSIPTESAIIVCAALPQSFPAPIYTDIIMYEAPHVYQVLRRPTESAIIMCATPPQSFPLPICTDSIVYEVPLVYQVLRRPTESVIIASVAPLDLLVASLDQEVLCKDTIVTDATVCVLDDAPFSGEASPNGSIGGAADVLQLAVFPESDMNMDQTSTPVPGDGSGYIYQSNESSAVNLHMTSSCSERGECAPSAPRIVASTIPISHARSIEMRPESRPRTFAEVVSGRVATHVAVTVAVTVVNPATGASTAMVALGGRTDELLLLSCP
ncbi:hypothetical protein FOA52_005752 [Chlamydomonas sp. UWO 241]|nr:hypothetical protein FOA52_005752 [Chlamydomonas sp. UWO 241]